MTINKRALLHGGLTISAALAAQAHRVTTAAKADAWRCHPSAESSGAMPMCLASAAADFGNIIHRHPQAVLAPASAADIAA